MARKPLSIGEFNFTMKKEAKDLYSQILNDARLGELLQGEDFDYVMALLLNHPRADEKIGVGVEGIKVDIGAHVNNRCFHVIRKDGTSDNFSIGKCIDGDHSDFRKFCVACRRAVENDIRAYKRHFFEENSNDSGMVKCQNSGKWISYDEAHVDHREPFTFSSIVHFFSKSNKLDLSTIEYITESEYGNVFADGSLINKFKEWHKDNAKLRIIYGKTNLSKGYLGRVASTKADGFI
ncbi:DUF3223 domain-containing protein [Vibrio cholerae]|uniref:DCL family protein n=1 Tax=Vibrio cholerae TaxID=666 RepID=UPI001E4518D0|nr:DCL family protein [Vibrio cholerae]MCD1171453.1 hypothetical protein [Vibrio cholerae]MCD1189583.1 DUF3223 domain-containing protein [Vibrio cholerae]HDZ9245492.1 DCL family protein [Vibrio cholerae]HDZ9485654.1 DCL family protein [Vibrio cholerae]